MPDSPPDRALVRNWVKFRDRVTLADIALYPWFEQVGALEQLSEFQPPLGCVGLIP